MKSGPLFLFGELLKPGMVDMSFRVSDFVVSFTGEASVNELSFKSSRRVVENVIRLESAVLMIG